MREGCSELPCAVLWGEFPWHEAAGTGAAGAGNGPSCRALYAARARQAMSCHRTLHHNHAINYKLFLCRCLPQACHHFKAAMNVTVQAGRICLPYLALTPLQNTQVSQNCCWAPSTEPTGAQALCSASSTSDMGRLPHLAGSAPDSSAQEQGWNSLPAHLSGPVPEGLEL